MIIDRVKSYWDAQPCNIKHSAKQVGSLEYFDEVTAKKLFVEPHIIDFCCFEQWNNKKVLEIGCGIGTMAELFARNGAKYTGIDLSESSVDLAIRRFAVKGLPGKFYVGNAEEDFLEDEFFDLVIAWGVVHHTPNPLAMTEIMSRRLNIDGTMKLMVYAKNSWKRIMIDARLDQYEAQAACPIAWTFSLENATRLIPRNCSLQRIDQSHIFPYKVEEYKHGRYVKEDWFNCMSPKMFEALERELGWHLLLTARKMQ